MIFLLCSQACKLRQRVLGDNHAKTTATLDMFAGIYAEVGRRQYAGENLPRLLACIGTVLLKLLVWVRIFGFMQGLVSIRYGSTQNFKKHLTVVEHGFCLAIAPYPTCWPSSSGTP